MRGSAVAWRRETMLPAAAVFTALPEQVTISNTTLVGNSASTSGGAPTKGPFPAAW